MLPSLFSLFYVTGEFHRFLQRGRAQEHNLQQTNRTLLHHAISISIASKMADVD